MRQRRLHQTRIEGRSRCPRTYSVPDCRPNQRRSSVSEQAQLFRRIGAGQTAENRITMDSSQRRGPGCRTNHSDGLKDLGATVLENGSRNRCSGSEHRKESIVLYCSSYAEGLKHPVPSHFSVSKNRLESYGVLLLSMVYTVRPSFWAMIDSALALPYLLTNLW